MPFREVLRRATARLLSRTACAEEKKAPTAPVYQKEDPTDAYHRALREFEEDMTKGTIDYVDDLPF